MKQFLRQSCNYLIIKGENTMYDLYELWQIGCEEVYEELYEEYKKEESENE